MASFEYDLQERRQALAEYLNLPLDEVLPSVGVGIHFYDVYTNEFYTPDGTYVVLDTADSDSAIRTEIVEFIKENGIDSFSEEFYDWILDNAVDDYIFDVVCRDDYQQGADSLEESAADSDDYDNALIEECVARKLISGFDVVDGKYIGDEDLKDLYAWDAYEKVLRDYGSYAKWYQSLYGNNDFAYTVGEWNAYDEDKIVDEAIERDGYTPLATYDGEVLELDNDYFGYKIDADDRRDEARVG